MAQPASVVIEAAASVLNDPGLETWNDATLLAWVNDGLRAIAALRPDAFVARKKWQLTAGKFVQALPTDTLRLLGPIYNMGTGSAPGRTIFLADRSSKDRYEPNWRAAAAAAEIKEYLYDPETNPKEIEVSPPAHASTAVWVEGVCSIPPASVDAAAKDLPCEDTFIPALIEWVTGRALSEDEESANLGLAAIHITGFFNLLNVKMRTDLLSSPKVRQAMEQKEGQ